MPTTKNRQRAPCVLLLFCFLPLLLLAQKTKDHPNIIYIMADDMGYADLSGYGRKDYQTPHLDALAAQGMKFTNAYATAPVCTPSRLAFMTGRYPARLPVGLREPLGNSPKDSTLGLTPETPSIASYLKTAGYATYLLGKWHLGYTAASSPMHNGFDYFFGFHAGATDYVTHRAPKGSSTGLYANDPDLYENDQPVKRAGYMTDLLRDKAIEIIRRPHAQPFFLALMFSAPHWPWEAPGDAPYADTVSWVSGGSPATYGAIVKSMDEAVNALLTALDEQGLSDNTVVFFTSDNGGEHFSDMGTYKGSKLSVWEGGVRVPAFVRWPGHIKPGSSTPQVAATMDCTATILSLAGARVQPDKPLDGIDLLAVLTGKKGPVPHELYWRLSQRNWQRALRDGDWKYVQDDKGTEYLFDLTKDPSERTNLRNTEPARFAAMKASYARWEASMLNPLIQK